MVKRMMVVLVALLLLNVGVAGAGTAGMTGLWNFDGTTDDGSGVVATLTGNFDFAVHTISLEGAPFFGLPYSISGSITDLLNGTYAGHHLVWSWNFDSGPVDDQLWNITNLGNGTASVVSVVVFIPENQPAIINGTLTSAVPLPGALWLVGAGLFGLGGLKRRSSKAIQ